MNHLRRLEDGELFTWSAVRVHEVPMLYMYVGQSRQSPTLCKEKSPAREQLVPGAGNIVNEPLVDLEKILIPPLHMKLGLIKQFTLWTRMGGTSTTCAEPFLD